MSTTPSEFRQQNSSPHIEESTGKVSQDFLTEIDTRIRVYLELNKEEMDQTFIQFHKSILKRCKWAVLMKERLTPEMENSLQCFAKQRLENIEELINWIDLTAISPH